MFIYIWHRILHDKRYIIDHELFHQTAHLDIGAENHCNLLPGYSLLLMHIHDFPYHFQVLVRRFLKGLYENFSALFSGRRHMLGIAMLIVANQPFRPGHNGTCGTIVSIQHSHFRSRIILCKSEKYLRSGAAKSINRLIIVAHYKKIILRSGKHPDNLILNSIDILKFINQYVGIFFLPGQQYVRPLLKKLPGLNKHIVIIQTAHSSEFLFVTCINILKHILRTIGRIKMLQRHHISLNPADLPGNIHQKIFLIVHLHINLMHDIPKNSIFFIFR